MDLGSAHADLIGMRNDASVEAMRRAARVLPRGTASGARLRTASSSLVMASGEGAILTDVDGNAYVDYVLGLGPVLLGHRPRAVLDAVRRSLERGILFGAQHEAEAELAERVVASVPCAEVVALVSTGSEGVQLAIRVARARTGRARIVKFDGHYHGWVDPLFVNTPGMTPIERSPAMPSHAVDGQRQPPDVTVVRWNAVAELESALAAGPPAAAVIMEPVPCNFGSMWPHEGYLERVAELCRGHGAVLIFDEVLTGFRLALGGAQERLGVTPDLTVCSKAIASGFPLAAVTGTADAMTPMTSGPVRPSGTFSGSPASVAAALATIKELAARRTELYPRLDRLGAALADGVRGAADGAEAPVTVNQVGSVLQLFWGVPGPVTSYADACRSDHSALTELAGRLLARGIHSHERGLLLLSAAHTEEHVERTVEAFSAALAAMTAVARPPTPIATEGLA